MMRRIAVTENLTEIPCFSATPSLPATIRRAQAAAYNFVIVL